MRDADCLQPRLAAIHCTALQRANYDEWSPHGGSVVWSPFSNLWLYPATTDVVAARDAGVRVCLGADWSPSGSKNLLGELKVADMWNRTHLNGELSAQEICAMATCNPADAINWGDKIGRLKTGLHGDVLVTTDRLDDPYRNLVKSIERDVQLVAINGQPFYGTTALMKAAGATRAEPIRRRAPAALDRAHLRRRPRRRHGLGPCWPTSPLAVKDPVKRYFEIEKLHEAGKPPPWLMTDKPWDDPAVTGKPVPVDVRIPPLDPLSHDAAFLAAVKASPLHGGLLDGLRDYDRAACAGPCRRGRPSRRRSPSTPASRRAGRPSGSASCRRRRTPRRRGRGCGSCRGA